MRRLGDPGTAGGPPALTAERAGRPRAPDSPLPRVGSPTRHDAAVRHAGRGVRLARMEIAAEAPLVSVDDALHADSHILPDYTFSKGDCAAALAASPKRVEGTLRIGGQEHFYLEGQVSLAIPGEDDVTIHASTQHPSELQHIVADVLGLPNAAVTVEVRRMGGAFGGKESQAAQWAAVAALATRITGRPCK